MNLRRTLLCTALVLGAAIVPVAGDAKESNLLIAPPAARVETVPGPAAGNGGPPAPGVGEEQNT